MIIPIDRTPSGWTPVPDEITGIPLWKWKDGPVYAATRDMDQLLFLGAALVHFDEMGIDDFHSFISAAMTRPDRPDPDRGAGCRPEVAEVARESAGRD